MRDSGCGPGFPDHFLLSKDEHPPAYVALYARIWGAMPERLGTRDEHHKGTRWSWRLKTVVTFEIGILDHFYVATSI